MRFHSIITKGIIRISRKRKYVDVIKQAASISTKTETIWVVTKIHLDFLKVSLTI